MTKSPRIVCPICGLTLPVGALRGHVGQTRCLLHFVRRDSKLHDEASGGKALELARGLDKILAQYREKGG